MPTKDFVHFSKFKTTKTLIGKFVEVVFISILVTFIVSLIMGCRPIYINGSSMRDSISFGSIILIKKASVEELQVGDTITFRLGNSGIPTTHKIHAIEGNKYITCGDYAGADPDDTPVSYNQIWGKYWFTIPYIGNLIRYVLNGVGAVTIVLFTINLFAIIYFFKTNSYSYFPDVQDNIDTIFD